MLLRIALFCVVAFPISSQLSAQSITGTGPANDPTRQIEGDWVDERWSKTDVGQFLRATIDTPRRRTAKALAIKVGVNNEATVCFDTDLLRYAAGWTGGFVRTHGQRYGLIAPLTPEGEMQFKTDTVPGWTVKHSFNDPREPKLGPLPREWAKYNGFYRSGNRVVLAYSVGAGTVLESPWFVSSGKLQIFTRSLEFEGLTNAMMRVIDIPDAQGSVEVFDGIPVAKLTTSEGAVAVSFIGESSESPIFVEHGAINLRLRSDPERARMKIFICKLGGSSAAGFAKFVKTQETERLEEWTKGGPTRWGEPLMTRGVMDRSSSAFAIDTITIPYENRWNALFFTAGHDFFRNGRAAVATIHGDVWVVSGLDQDLQNISWRRFATGLYQPLGLRIIDDKVHVLERDQITILHDLDQDDEADFYENFNNDCLGAGGGHSYTTCLETDSRGDFYFTKCAENTPHGGTVLRVPKDGSRIEVIATGFRNPNGMGIGPGDLITVADQQGDWVPETRLDVIRRGGFYGFTPMHKRTVAPTTFDLPLVWIPRSIDNSAGGQVWVPEGVWGELSGQMLHLSFGRCTMMMVLRDANSPEQGAVVPLPGRFASGVCRGRFSPADKHLYVTGLRGWQTAAVRDGCFQRVRYQKEAAVPVAYSVTAKEVRIKFSQKLDRELAEDVENYGAEMWNYKWSSNYGSPDFSVKNQEQQGRDRLEITGARLEKERTVVLTIEGLQIANQLAIQYNLESAEGETIQSSLFATIKSVGGRSGAE